MLTVFKRHNKCDIFNEWSLKSTKYSQHRNTYFHNRIQSYIDINFLINVLKRNKVDIKYVERMKKVKYITADISGIKKTGLL